MSKKLELNIEPKKTPLSFESITNEKKKLDLKQSNGLDIPEIEFDDKVLVDLFRDPELYEKFVEAKWQDSEDTIEKKTTKIFQIMMDLNALVQEYSTNYILAFILGTVPHSKIPTEKTYISYKSKFAELRLQTVTLRADGVKLEGQEEHDFIIESGELFDFYVKTIVDAFILSVKEGNE